jgi:hypothetical protein
VGWLAGGKFHSGRLKKKLNAKHKEDQKALYKQYYNDVVRGRTCVRASARALARRDAFRSHRFISGAFILTHSCLPSFVSRNSWDDSTPCKSRTSN